METVVLPAQDHLAQERYRHQSRVMSGMIYPLGGLPRPRRKVKSSQQDLVTASVHSEIAKVSSYKCNITDSARNGLISPMDMSVGVLRRAQSSGPISHLPKAHQYGLSNSSSYNSSASQSTATPILNGVPAVPRQILRTKSDGALLQHGLKKSVEGEKTCFDRKKAHERRFEGSKVPAERKVVEKNPEKSAEKSSDRRKGSDRRTTEKKAFAGANGSQVDKSSNVQKKAGVITILQRPQTKEAAAENIALFTGRPIDDVTKQFLKSFQAVSQKGKWAMFDAVEAVTDAGLDGMDKCGAWPSYSKWKDGVETDRVHSSRGSRNVSPKRERIAKKKGSRDSSNKVAARLTEAVHVESRQEVEHCGEAPRSARPTHPVLVQGLKAADADNNVLGKDVRERESWVAEFNALMGKSHKSSDAEGNAPGRDLGESEARMAEDKCLPEVPKRQEAEKEAISELDQCQFAVPIKVPKPGSTVPKLFRENTQAASQPHIKKCEVELIATVQAVKDADLNSKDGGEAAECVQCSGGLRNGSPKRESVAEKKGSRDVSGKVAALMTDGVHAEQRRDVESVVYSTRTDGVHAEPRRDVEYVIYPRKASSHDSNVDAEEPEKLIKSWLALMKCEEPECDKEHNCKIWKERAASLPLGFLRGSSDTICRELGEIGETWDDSGLGGVVNGPGSIKGVFSGSGSGRVGVASRNGICQDLLSCSDEGIEVYYLPSSPPKKCERWAGPAYTKSPPPSTLPFPTFPLQRVKLGDVVWQGSQDTNSEALSSSGHPSPTHMANLFLSAAAMQQSPFVDPSSATKDLRRMLNLDVADGFDGGVESATQSLKRMLQLG